MTDTDPLIVTLAMDQPLFEKLNSLRQAHFPPERNFLPAHVTLFHNLPGHRLQTLTAQLEKLCFQTHPFHLNLPSLRSLGKGIAITVDSPSLIECRANLATLWQDDLTPQDQQRYSPHITIQNKVDPSTAKNLMNDLSPWQILTGQATGLILSHYRNGPWQQAATFTFAATQP